MTSPRYDFRVDLAVDNAHTRVIRLVGDGARVLELGCASGYVSRVLTERFACRVTGIERDAEAAAEARKCCQRVIVGDLETLDYARELGDQRFDVILAADVLEHLRDPSAVLRGLRPFLGPDGRVVASIPNVTHVSVVVELLEGRFPYQATGLLDDTHLRFFARDGIYACFEQAGFVVSHLERLHREPQETEFRTDLSRVPPELRRLLCAQEESTTYQFMVVARPAPADQIAQLAGHLARAGLRRGSAPAAPPDPAPPEGRPSADGTPSVFWQRQATGLVDAMLGRMTYLEGERARQERHIEDLETRLDDLRTRVAHYEPHSRNLEALLAHERSRADALQARVHALEATAAWRFQAACGRWRAALCPPGSRRERLYLRLRGRPPASA